MRRIGCKWRRMPGEADMDRFGEVGFSEHTRPENYIDRFAGRKDVSYNHLMATLQERITWNGMQAVLTGVAPKEIVPPGKAKRPMTFVMEPKTP